MGKLIDNILKLATEITQKEEQDSVRTVKNVIGFFGVKDGLGVSTVVANVATVLASNNFKVCVIDLDMHYPVMSRLLMKKSQIKDMISVRELFTNASLGVAEVLNDTSLPNLKLVSPVTWDQPTSYFDLSTGLIRSTIKSISKLFDFILIDLGGADVAYETTTNGIGCCDQVYTLISPTADIIEATYKAFRFLSEFNYYKGNVSIIQNMVVEDPVKPAKLKEWGFEHLLDLPFYSDIIKLRYNDQIIVKSSMEGKAAKIWKNSMMIIASTISSISDASNYTVDDTKEDETMAGELPPANEQHDVKEQANVESASQETAHNSPIEAEKPQENANETEPQEILDLDAIDWEKYTGGGK